MLKWRKIIGPELSLALLLACLSACRLGTDNKKAVSDIVIRHKDSATSVAPGSEFTLRDSSIRFFADGDAKYIQLGSFALRLPAGQQITRDNIYNGVYVLTSESLARRTFFFRGNIVFITTFSDVGMGVRTSLYAFDTAHKRFIKDFDFNQNSLASSAGIIIIDSVTKRIFVIDKSGYFEKKRQFVIPAVLYEGRGAKFKALRMVYKPGEQIPGDTTGVVLFFQAAMSTGKKRAPTLPDDWWKDEKDFGPGN